MQFLDCILTIFLWFRKTETSIKLHLQNSLLNQQFAIENNEKHAKGGLLDYSTSADLELQRLMSADYKFLLSPQNLLENNEKHAKGVFLDYSTPAALEPQRSMTANHEFLVTSQNSVLNQPSTVDSLVISTEPTVMPTQELSEPPTMEPSLEQPGPVSSSIPTLKSSIRPSSRRPSMRPSSIKPSYKPSFKPSSIKPSLKPSFKPSSIKPSLKPSYKPSLKPSYKPSFKPSSIKPSLKPSYKPSYKPSNQPTAKPVLVISTEPTEIPTQEPSEAPTQPTLEPSEAPTIQPTLEPSEAPTIEPTKEPSEGPTQEPTQEPSQVPTKEPSEPPTQKPSAPTSQPSSSPTTSPSLQPTSQPSCTLGKLHKSGLVGCFPCEPGYYANDALSEYCTPCPAGFYENDYGSSECKQCPFPRTAYFKGSSSCQNFSLFVSEAFVWGICIFMFLIFVWGHLTVTADLHQEDPRMNQTAYQRRAAVLINTILPVYDDTTNLAYILKETFYSPLLFSLCVVALMHSSFYFVARLFALRATPIGFITFIRKFIWLGYTSSIRMKDLENEQQQSEQRHEQSQAVESDNAVALGINGVELLDASASASVSASASALAAPMSNYIHSSPNFASSSEDDIEQAVPRRSSIPDQEILPNNSGITRSNEAETDFAEGADGFPMATIYGSPFLPITFAEHSSLFILLWELFGWILAIALQVACLSVAVAAYIPFVICWFAVGIVVQHMKMLIIGRAWNFWFAVWTGDDTFAVSNTLVDTEDFNAGVIFHFVAESVPNLILQAVNNNFLGEWNPLSIMSIAGGGFAVLNGLYTFVYFRYFRAHKRIALKNIPVHKTLRLKLPTFNIDWLIIDAKLNSEKKDWAQLTAAGKERLNKQMTCFIFSDYGSSKLGPDTNYSENQGDVEVRGLQRVDAQKISDREIDSGGNPNSSIAAETSSGPNIDSDRVLRVDVLARVIQEDREFYNRVLSEMAASYLLSRVKQEHSELYERVTTELFEQTPSEARLASLISSLKEI